METLILSIVRRKLRRLASTASLLGPYTEKFNLSHAFLSSMATPAAMSFRNVVASGADLASTSLPTAAAAGQSTQQRRRSVDISKAAAARQFIRPTAWRGHHGLVASRQHSQVAWHQQQTFATAAADVARIQDEPSIAVGSILEFRRPNQYILGLVLATGPAPQSWKIEDAQGTIYNVKDKDVVYILPGSRYTPAELAEVSTQAAANSQDTSLLAVAWELSEPGVAVYSIEEMADLLFGNASAASCAASQRLLRSDKLYFKVAGRTPPMYTARPESQVKCLRIQLETELKAVEEMQVFVQEVEQAKSRPRTERPKREDWLASPDPTGPRFKLLEEYALGRPMINSTLAIQILKAFGAQPTPQGAAEVLQASGFWPPHVQLGLLASNLTRNFSTELESAAESMMTSPPPDPDGQIRRDLSSNLHVITIDDSSTTEIDDGLSAEVLNDGNIKVWIHVADPTRWIDPGSALDIEAKRRSKTLYLPTGMVPMFPLSLAEGPFSLREGEPSNALTITAVVDKDTGLVVEGSAEVWPSLITPSQRLTYDNVDEMLIECTAEEEPVVHALAQVASARKALRASAGAVEIIMPESKVRVKKPHSDAPAVNIEAADMSESQSRQLVAELMILAGEIAATFGAKFNLSLPYRGQNEPVLPSEEQLAAHPPGPCRMALLRTCMTRSITAADAPVRHAGLGLEGYVQITSPIRRYGDLLAHWQLKAAIRGDTPPFNTLKLSEELAALASTTQHVSKLERDANSYWVALYFKESLAESPNKVWTATFLNWFKQESGLGRVLLDDLGLETLIKVTHAAMPGNKLRVCCVSADPLLGMYRLEESTGSSMHEE